MQLTCKSTTELHPSRLESSKLEWLSGWVGNAVVGGRWWRSSSGLPQRSACWAVDRNSAAPPSFWVFSRPWIHYLIRNMYGFLPPSITKKLCTGFFRVHLTVFWSKTAGLWFKLWENKKLENFIICLLETYEIDKKTTIDFFQNFRKARKIIILVRLVEFFLHSQFKLMLNTR